MSLEDRINRPCVVLGERPSSERDELGNEVTERLERDTVCELQRADDQVNPENPEGVSETRWRLFFLPGEDVRKADKVRVPGPGGGVFEVHGDPDHTRNPRTAQMRQVEVYALMISGAQEGGGS